VIHAPAIGRKNFLFTGSADTAQRLASAYALVQTCRALGTSTREYWIDVIGKLESGWLLRRIGELDHVFATDMGTWLLLLVLGLGALGLVVGYRTWAASISASEPSWGWSASAW
jgi:hypothetical protein